MYVIKMSELHRKEDIIKASFLSTIGKLEKPVSLSRERVPPVHWQRGG